MLWAKFESSEPLAHPQNRVQRVVHPSCFLAWTWGPEKLVAATPERSTECTRITSPLANPQGYKRGMDPILPSRYIFIVL